MKMIIATNLMWIIIFGTSIVSAQDLVQIGLQKQLMVDDYVIAEKQNIIRELGTPKKQGVVMGPSTPTDFDPDKKFPDGLPEEGGYDEFGRRLSVIWNEKRQIFQMLYRASGEGITGYAESEDGITWAKPKISQDGKSNLVTHRGKNRGTFYEASFMIDPNLPWGHPEKYKAAYNPGNTQCAIGYSSDGIHWTGYNDGNSVTGRAADTFNQIFWDPIKKSFLLLTRTDLGDMGGTKESRSSRIMIHEKGNDLLSYSTAWKTIVNVAIDDPEKKITKLGVPELQMESLNIWVHENVYFGLMHVLTAGELTGSEGRVAVPDPDKRPDADVIDYYIGTSRDGINFDMTWVFAKKPFVVRGPDGSFDKGMLQPSPEIITRQDEHLIYYTGQYSQHHAPEKAKKQSGKIGLAILPRDRFIGQKAGETVGTIITKPFELNGSKLELNVDAKDGWVKVELLDATGEEIKGYSGNASKQYNGIDELRLTPKLGGRGDLSRLLGKTIKLKFTLKNATLYAFEINI